MENLRLTHVDNNPDFTLLRSRTRTHEDVTARAAMYRPVYHPHIKVAGRKGMDIQDLINSEGRVLIDEPEEDDKAKSQGYKSKQVVLDDLNTDQNGVGSKHYKIFDPNAFKGGLLELQKPHRTARPRDPSEDLVSYCEYLRGVQKV